MRLQQLLKPGQDHTWVTHLANSGRPALAPAEWLTAIRIRQGCWFTREATPCAVCGDALDPQALHSMCCTQGESARGHNSVRDAVYGCLREVDATAEKEVPGLIASNTSLRPTDILTKATRMQGEGAVDIMIRSPICGQCGGSTPRLQEWRGSYTLMRHMRKSWGQ